jgi:lactase-phlorizin hydrolase
MDFAGRVGITLNVNWMEPEDPSDPNHVEASNIKLQFDFGWFARPILVDGQYPDVMREKVDSKSILQGYPESRLPFFTPEEEAEIAGSADFLGINHYTTNLVYLQQGDISTPSFFEDDDVVNYTDDTMYGSGSIWLKVAPFGLRKIVNWIRDNFGDYEIFITENGVSDGQGNLDDLPRIYFYKHYLNQLLRGDHDYCMVP